METIRLSLPSAIASVLGMRRHPEYRNVGQNMLRKDLAALLGLSANTMLTHYTSGKTKSIEPERALVLLDRFNILIDAWLTEQELREDATNKEFSAKIARGPIQEIVAELVRVEATNGSEDAIVLKDIRRGLRKLIARYY